MLAAEQVDRTCALCGLPESHLLHARVTHPRRRRVVDGIRQHMHLDAAEGVSDGRRPERGSLRWPGWRPLDEISGVPMAEAYEHPASGAFLWREPGSCRWRWGRLDASSGVKTYSVSSRTWLHEAIAEVWRP